MKETNITSSTNHVHPYQRTDSAVEHRVDDLLGRMPLSDKVGLMFHTMVFAGDLNGSNPILPLTPVRDLIANGRLTHFNVFGSTITPGEFAEWHNQLQRIAAEQPLGIPVTLSSDPRNHFTDNPLASMFAGPFSLWPEPLGLAAIGSDELVQQFADVARQEYIAVGLRAALHPQIDLATEPRWCRINSTFGEDADLTSRLVVAYLRGFQGERLGPTSVAAMTKHFPGGGPQKDGSDPHFTWGREQVYPGGMFRYHLQPFLAAIEAGTAQMMPYYGMPVGTEYEEVGFSYNRAVITGLLREELGFDGVICTDWGLITDKPELGDVGAAKAWGVEHLSVDDRIVKLLEAGVDQFGGEECTENLVELVRSGRISEDRIDESARRLLRLKFELGLFDNPYVDAEAAEAIVGCPSFRAAGERAQQRAVTVLVNELGRTGPTLPLPFNVRIYAEGIDSEALRSYGLVVAQPSEADIAILRLRTPWEPTGKGGFSDLFHTGTLEFDPNDIEHVVEVCRCVPTVIDVYLERPAVITPFAREASAIVANFGINAAALLKVLFGEAAPEGRLPFDLPRSMAAVEESRTDVPYDTEEPLFRFGHGLLYSNGRA